jgi:hypothetical protein
MRLAVGFPPLQAVLVGTGVTINQLRSDALIPCAAYSAILDNAARLSDRDDFGSLLGRRQTLAALGPLGDVMRHAATLGEAIAAFAAFQIRNSTGGAVYLLRSERDVILGYGIYDPMVRASHHIYDMVLAVGCNLVAELTQGSVGPAEVFSLRPKPGDPAQYQRIGYLRRWKREGVWSGVLHTLVMADRERTGREASPSAAIRDSQTVRTTDQRGIQRVW